MRVCATFGACVLAFMMLRFFWRTAIRQSHCKSLKFVVLTHGMGASRKVFRTVKRHLERRGYHVLDLGVCEGRCSISTRCEDQVRKIRRAIEEFFSRTGNALNIEWHAVGHSQGGLLLRAALQEACDCSTVKIPRCETLVTLASPHLGIEDASPDMLAWVAGESALAQDMLKAFRELSRKNALSFYEYLQPLVSEVIAPAGYVSVGMDNPDVLKLADAKRTFLSELNLRPSLTPGEVVGRFICMGSPDDETVIPPASCILSSRHDASALVDASWAALHLDRLKREGRFNAIYVDHVDHNQWLRPNEGTSDSWPGDWLSFLP
jgi:pimeloyl-ACP methyl ester carboxylesterase